VVVLSGLPDEAGADYLFTPFIGGAFGAKSAFITLDPVDTDAGSTKFTFGGSVAWLSPGILGAEADVAYAPTFFERNNNTILGSSMWTLHGSVIAAVPLSVTQYSLRPYLVGGLGLGHSGITFTAGALREPVDDTSLAMNVGGGAVGFITARTGVRFELRHFRTLERASSIINESEPRLSFWRATVGVVIRR